MNKRTLLIAAGLALPVIILGIIAYPGPKAPKNTTAAARHAQTLEEARTAVKNRLEYLEKMTPAQWPEEQRRNPRVPPTLDQALAYNRNRLAELNAMTQEQWQSQQPPSARPKPQQTPAPAALAPMQQQGPAPAR